MHYSQLNIIQKINVKANAHAEGERYKNRPRKWLAMQIAAADLLKEQSYLTWTTLDKAAHILRCRLQLVTLCIESLKPIN